MSARVQSLGEKAWGLVLRNGLLPIGDLVFGQRMMRRLRFLEQAPWWDFERLAAERNRALQHLVQVAYAEVPLYRELMDKACVRPDEIQTPDDLQRLPVVTKELLRENYPARTTRKTGRRVFEARTSGSTGTNFRVAHDNYTAGWYRASFLSALGWAGWRFGERHVQTGMAYARSFQKKLKDWLLSCHYVPANKLDDASLDQTREAMEDRRINHLRGYPSSLYYLARRAREKGWNRPLASLVTWGGNLYPHYRRTMEDVFKVRVHDTYGCAEGIQISAQCGCGDTYHVHALDTVLELLDQDGRPVSPGEPGHVVLTRLHPGPMPLIRYRVGDIARAGTAARCACGRGFPTMAGIQGRDTDVVVTPSGKRLIVHFFTGILEHFSEVGSFQVVQQRPEAMLLRIKPTPTYSKTVERTLIGRLRELGADDLAIEVETVTELALTPGGKRRFTISQLAQRPDR
ncbi:MAG: phenylacetate--CoA ligase family protein [Verrucomicrobia bacterium]|nr:phenylacetate--CoA ligase family protein [Verrucomicrobiota bacterium]